MLDPMLVTVAMGVGWITDLLLAESDKFYFDNIQMCCFVWIFISFQVAFWTIEMVLDQLKHSNAGLLDHTHDDGATIASSGRATRWVGSKMRTVEGSFRRNREKRPSGLSWTAKFRWRSKRGLRKNANTFSKTRTF